MEKLEQAAQERDINRLSVLRSRIKALEQQQHDGYARQPVAPGEFDVWEPEQDGDMTMFESLPGLPIARRWRGQAQPIPAVMAVIRRGPAPDARYLLIQRQTSPYNGQWALVGGKWDFGEPLAAAITREVKEETGLNAEFVALRGVVNERIAPHGLADTGAHFLLFVCELAADAGEAREHREGPVAWFDAAGLRELAERRHIALTDYAILEHIARAPRALPWLEAEVIASDGHAAPDQLVRFAPGP